jgi:hypothetical protein
MTLEVIGHRRGIDKLDNFGHNICVSVNIKRGAHYPLRKAVMAIYL